MAAEHTSFDILGRVTASKQTTDGVTYGNGSTDSLMTYAYNLSGAMIEQQYPSGRKVKNTLDASGDLEMVTSRKNANSGYWAYANNFTYNAAGAVTSMQLGNGAWESTVFNSRLQAEHIYLGTTATGTQAYDKLKLDYSYGTTANNGNVLTQTITVATVGASTGFAAVQTYNYDSLNRLKDATESLTPTGGSATETWKQTFTFDRYGNRTFDEANTTTLPKNCGSSPSLTVCTSDQKKFNPSVQTANNRLVLDQDSDSTADYAYDSSGNTTKDADSRTFVYDAENKQVEVKNSSNATIGQYFYDGDGKRVKKYVPSTGETTIFVYDAGGKLVAEYSTIVANSTDAKVAYLTNDHLGSPRINTDINGNVTARHDYHPFGEEIATSQRTTGLGYADDTVRKQFTGYERDIESSLDFAEARYYNPMHGRFTSPDDFFNDTHVSEPQSWNLYAYVRNNPLVFVDPTGMRATDFIDIGTGDRVHIDDGKDQVIAAQSADIAQFQKEINSDRAAYDERLRVFENSANNLHMNTAQFNDLAGVIYAEASNNATWQESAGIHGVLRNRAAADGNSVLDQANDTSQVFGANDKGKIFSPNASQSKVNAVYKGIALSVVTGKDISNGAYYWHGTDFRRPTAGSKAHERFYKTGFQFTSPSHNIWNLPDKKSGSRKYDFKYESTGAQGQTTFMKLTQAWMKANGATRWNGK